MTILWHNYFTKHPLIFCFFPVKTIADCKIAPDGDYPHPTSCTKFINCQNGLGAEASCQLFLHFNRTSRRCDFHPQNAGCAFAKSTGNVTRPRPGNAPLLRLINWDWEWVLIHSHQFFRVSLAKWFFYYYLFPLQFK